MYNIVNKLSGILWTALLSIPAWMIGEKFPIVGSPILGILLGMIVALWKRPASLEKGISFASKNLLQYSIILLGFNMNLYNILKVGSQTVILILFTLTATFLAAYYAGKLLKLDANTKVLIGVGTAICGGSAIAATSPVIHADDDEVARSISTIFLFNSVAAFTFPFIGHFLQMSDSEFGLWTGTAVNDTSAVVAAGYTFSSHAGDMAVIVKLTRTLMIVPITLLLAFLGKQGRHKNSSSSGSKNQLLSHFPWFILGFMIAAVMNTFLPLSSDANEMLVQMGKFMIVMAMVAIGLNMKIVQLFKHGLAPILLGLSCWTVLCLTSLAVQYFVLR